jgi:hypothetical protein
MLIGPSPGDGSGDQYSVLILLMKLLSLINFMLIESRNYHDS